MVELLDRITSLKQKAETMRGELPATEEERCESRLRSVYASLAIEDSSVTFEEVQRVLSTKVG